MNIPDQEKVLKEKIKTYNKIANFLMHSVDMARITNNFSISLRNDKEFILKKIKLSVVDLLVTLEDVYDEYTYLNELYREESK
jgi:hypothetical protein